SWYAATPGNAWKRDSSAGANRHGPPGHPGSPIVQPPPPPSPPPSSPSSIVQVLLQPSPSSVLSSSHSSTPSQSNPSPHTACSHMSVHASVLDPLASSHSS